MGGSAAPMTPSDRTGPSSSDGGAPASAVPASDRPIGDRKPGLSRKLAIVVIGSRATLLAVAPSNRARSA
jgi:hypothetical protein